MELTTFNFWGKTKYWWRIMLVGILLIPAGLWLLLQPVMGYAVISMLLGWGLILFGVVQLTVSGDIEKRGQGWGWWLAGGIFDIFIGFLLISNLALSELTLPYFFAFIFLFKGLSNIISAFSMTSAYKYWWLYLINGIIMLLISFLFFFTPFTAAYSIVFLCSFVFVYWGVALIIFSYDVKPDKTIEQPK